MVAVSNLIDIDSEWVLHNLGYVTDCEPPGRAVSLVKEYAENAGHFIEPSYTYVVRDVEWVQGSITFLEDSAIFKSEVIAQLLEPCEKVAVFVLTIGKHLEEMVCHLAEDGLVLQAAVLDAIGSGAVEGLAGFVQDRIAEEACSQGLCISRRFSPGYCDWSIGQQRMLFQVLKGDTVGIHLTSRCLMIPQKSLSGIIGIGPCNSNIEDYNPCNKCEKQGCPGWR